MSKDSKRPEAGLSQLLARLQRGELKPEEALRQLSTRPETPPSEPPWPPIAVIGMAGRFPGAPDLASYWSNLTQGLISVGPIPPERWLDDAQPGNRHSPWGGLLADIDQFDPLFFALSPREAELMDPQQRLFLLEAWRALEEAGYGDSALDKRACGVFVGCGPSDYLLNLYRHGVDPDALAFTGNSNPILAARIAFLLNLRGPAIAIDTACSSSLVAVILACESIAAGTSELALAGGVSVFTTPQTHRLSGRAGMLSATGRCYTFDARADGFVPAEGVGVVVLKRLDLAQRDGDHIHGVIRASGLNQDGRSNGITAPSASSQTALIRDIYRRYGIAPDHIGLIEAHGTGTQLGDPIEVAALLDAYGPGPGRDCVLGSVKANIGHASSAAGIAGLLKLLLCLKHQQRPPLAGFERLNPHIDLTGSGLRLLERVEPWPAVEGRPRLAALSSFGFSGTNAHVVISEAAPVVAAPPSRPGWRLYVVSGQDDAGFRRRCHDLAAWLDAHPETDPVDLSYTLLLGRTHGRRRDAVVAADIATFQAELRHWAQGHGTVANAENRSAPPAPVQILLDRARTQGPDTLSGDELNLLANAYRAGMTLAWAALFSGQPRRLSLPTYPFDLRRYWIPAELCGTLPPDALPHPLLDRPNWVASTGPGLIFEKTMSADWPLLAEHRVWDRPTLPAMAALEMVFAAARRVAPTTPFAVVDLVWMTPCQTQHDAITLRLRLTQDGADYPFELASQQGSHVRGRLVVCESARPPPVDLAGFMDACPQAMDGEPVRAFYARRGLGYGPSFQGLQQLRLGQHQLLGWIALPPGTRRGPGVYWLDPALADAGLQAAAWLCARPDIAPEGVLLPHRLRRAEWLRPLPMRGVVCARLAGPLTLDMLIVDEHGQVAARLEGLTLAQQAAPPSLPPAAAVFLDAFDHLELWAKARLWQVLAERLPEGGFNPDHWAEAQAILPKYRRLWSVLLGLLAEGGYVEVRADGVTVPTGPTPPDEARLQAERQRLIAAVPAIAPFARLLWDCTAALWAVLTGATEITRVLFPTGSAEDVAGIYAGHPLADAYNDTLARLAADLAAHHRGTGAFRILEIGGGTGSASDPVIAALEGVSQPVEYHFSDISPAFVRRARTRFPQSWVFCQGFDLESENAPPFTAAFDLIIAANVVHATRSIAGSLQRIQNLLAPGGVLLLNEITARTAFGALTFGLTDGWWAFDHEEARLPGSPLLDGPGWERALAAAGFHGVESHGADWCAGHALDHRVWLARTVGRAEARDASFVRAAVASSPPPTALEDGNARLDSTPCDADLHYVRRVLAEVLKTAPEAIQPESALEEYGVDSLVTQQIVSAFAADLGNLPATLVYEYPTAHKLAVYFRDRHGPRLDAQHPRHVPVAPFAPAPAPVRPATAPETGTALDIAIIGLAGRYPLADDLDEFWENLKAGKDCISEVPAERWDWRPYYDPNPETPGKTYTAQGGFLRDAASFDARFFRISPREADDMDPQERLFLETAWHCVEQAGYDPLALGKAHTVGVFVGVMNANYSQLAAEVWRPGLRTGARVAYWSIANRVSFCLDYRGPSLAVDTACSSSLTALHLACHSLLRGECAVAVAGGVNLILHPAHLVCLADLRMLSPDGRCRSFGAGAEGFVDGEGVGAVLLKPLHQALADGDAIWGVIKGSALNSGGRTTGYTVPSPEAQGRLVTAAIAQAGIDLRDLGYVEAHGTGTALGDPIELAGLRAAFDADPSVRAIGSVKSNIGHTEAAAGIAGLTKLLLQLRHRTLVASLHADTLNPKLDLGTFRVVTQRQDWPPPAADRPRCAGLSSFGAGGANAHVVIQDAPALARIAPPIPGPFLLPFSARDAAALERLLRGFQAWLSHQNTDAPYWLQDVAFTLQLGRTALAERVAVVVEHPAALAATLAAWLAGTPGAGIYNRTAGDAQPLGHSKAGRAYLEAALKEREWDVLARLWTSGVDIDWASLWAGCETRRRSLPLYPFARVRHWLKVPATASEPSADTGLLGALLPAASLAEGVCFGLNIAAESPLVAQHRVGGRAVLPGVVSLILGLAAHERVIPGADQGLAEVQWLQPVTVESDVPLRLRVARDAQGGLRFEVLQGEACHAWGRYRDQDPSPEPPPACDEVRARLSDWQPGDQIYAALRALGIEHGAFYRVISRYAATARESLAELVLSADQHLPGAIWQPALLDGALQTIAGIAGLGRQALLPFRVEQALFLHPPGDRAWCHAEQVGEWRFRVALYSADGQPAAYFQAIEARPLSAAVPTATDPLAELFYVPHWYRCAPEALRFAEPPSSLVVCCAAEQTDAVAALSAAYPGLQVLALDSPAADLAALPDPLQLVFLAPAPSHSLDADGGCLALLSLLKTLAAPGYAGRTVRLLVLTQHALSLWPDDPALHPHAAALHGLALAAAREFPELAITCIDGDASAHPLALGLNLPVTRSLVAIRAGHVYQRRLEPVHLPTLPTPYRPGGVYLIIGGAGGLGLALAEDLTRRFQARVFLTGRSELDPTRLQAIAALGQVRYLRADATDPAAMAQVLAQVEAAAGAVHGVFHCALVLADRALRQMDDTTFLAALAPKMRAAYVLDQCLQGRNLDFLAFFSSAQSFLGNAGQANYTAGCTFIDAWAAYLSQHRPYPVRVLNWGFWGEIGAVATPDYARRLQAQGILPIATHQGLAATEQALAAPLRQIVPFRATAKFLAQAGIGTGSGWRVRRPEYPTCLPAIETDDTDTDALAAIAQGLQRLDRAAAAGFLRGMIEAGISVPGDSETEISATLPARFRALVRAALPVLANFGLATDTVPPPPDLDAIDRDYPELAAYTGLLRMLLPTYAAILSGRLSPTDVLFPEGSTERVAGIYQGHVLADGINRMAGRVVAHFVADCPAPDIHILEIGAGTGATSAVLLAALEPYAHRVRYVFSDVSPTFVKQARETYAARYPYARFEIRDITRTPTRPEELGAYDLVIAANVLHATPDLRATLDHVRMLLRPQGLLVLNEVTANSPYTTFTFGLLDGWWAFRDGLRLPGGPLLDRAGWRRLLAEQGFYGYADGGFAGLDQQLILAASGVLAPNVTLETDSSPPQDAPRDHGLKSAPTPLAADPDLQQAVERLITTAMADTLEIDPQELSVDTPHAEFGLDSILGVEVVSRINRAGGFELAATDVFNYPTIRELARYIVAHQRAAHATQDQTPPAPDLAATTATSRPLLPADPDAIAIVGMACRFPGAPDVDAFWELLKAGRDAVRPIPPERWSLTRWYDPDPKQPGKTYSQWAGWLDDYDHFDPAFFTISPREAELMDPQQRQFLMVAWHALEHAGYGDRSLARQRCGIVVGAGAGDYRQRLVADHFEADGAFAFMGNSDAILAGRLAYLLDLHGPCLTLDTACSSSLVAVHLARESLLRGETDMVLAGGVTVQTTAQFHVLSAKAGMLSPTGRCRPFDAAADGIVPGEGVAVVVLKRLADALAAGDRIHAVIAGSGINQDGRTNGITAPSAPSQTALITEIYQRHSIDPDHIGYVEAHGTGTTLGDPIEVQALTAAFRQFTAREGYCGLGSVKSNIGHALAAAGIAGLIKAVLCLEHRTQVPSLHFQTLNPHIRLTGSPFTVCRAVEDWPVPPGGVRHAAVSAFGFSGTNAHVVLREAPPVPETPTPGRARLPLALSAQTRTALLRRARDLAMWLAAHPATRLEDLAATLWLGRAHLPYRLATVAGSPEEFRQWLEQPGLESLIQRAKPRDDAPATDLAAGESALLRLASDPPIATDLDTVTQAYLQGWPLAWGKLFQGIPFRRLALPVYPFDTAPYGIPSSDDESSVATRPHPLIDSNISTLAAQCFAWCPDPTAVFIDQHRVNGLPVMPAVAFLEQARVAGELSLPQAPNLIRDLELRQILACHTRPAVRIRLLPDGAAARFEIVSEAATLHAQGQLAYDEGSPPPPVPVQSLWDHASERHSGERCYSGMRRFGIEHGPAYRLLTETARHAQSLFARLAPPPVRLSDWLIQPFITDAMLQAAAVYFAELSEAAAWLPVRIARTRIFAPGMTARWARLNLVQGDPASEDRVSFDAALLDAQGHTLLAMTGVVFQRVLPRAVPVDISTTLQHPNPPTPLVRGALAPSPDKGRAGEGLRERLSAEVLAQVAQVLKVAPEDVDPEDDLSSYGFDSIGFTALADRLDTRLGLALAPSVFFEHRSLGAFLDYLLRAYGPQLQTVLAPNTVAVANDAVPVSAQPTAPRFIQTVATRNTDEPIAIIGYAGRMPGARDLDDFWQKLLAVECMVREIPPERWDWQAIFGDPARERNKCNVRHGAFLDEVDCFDPLFFGISPREAEAMDPQQRLFLETVWHAIEDAGYRASALAGRKIGVFAGVANFDYHELWRTRTGDINAHAATGTAHSIVPNRVSFLLDFKGPSEPVDTACSSGLVAVYRAMAAIREGSCELAVAGAVNVMLTPTLHIAFNQAGMLNPDGQCRTFDQDAAGYVRGEGVGAVLLKPLSRAEADGDTIHGVLLGGALYHGGHANSLTAPNPATQAELLVEAYQRAGVAVEQVSYIEAHGTGTRLGDPAEVSGLINAFARLRAQQGGPLLPESCGLGSVKTNIGHLETAAGIAGLLKILLAMRHGQLPGNAHFRTQNPYIKLDASPFYILQNSRPWQPRDTSGQPLPRIAGISSFGFGGAYAHLVVREAPARPVTAESGQDELFVFSAKAPDRLRALVESWQEFAQRQGNGVRFADAAHTSRVGREAYAYRLAGICGQWATLAAALTAFLAGESHPALLSASSGSTSEPTALRRIAAQWLAGGDPDWQALAPASARRVSIPGYPFARERYWPPLNVPPGDALAAHPLAGSNQATLYRQKYGARLSPDYALLRDHQVAGQGLLPATAYLEWARAVGSLATEQPIAALAQLTWHRPLRAGGQGVDIHAELEPEADQVRFDLYSGTDDMPVLHAQGWLVLDPPTAPATRLDLAAVRGRCPTHWPEERCYAFFAELALNYGPEFRVLREVAFGEREALGRIQHSVTNPAYDWQPALLDGLLQTGAVLMAGYRQPGLLLPYALARFTAFRPLTASGWVHARLVGLPGPEGAALDLDYYDDAGTLLARMDGLTVRPLLKASPPPEPDVATLAFRRNWEQRDSGEGVAVDSVLVFDETGELFAALAATGLASQRLAENAEGACFDPEQPAHWQNVASLLESRPFASLVVYFPETSTPARTLRVSVALLHGLGARLARAQIRLTLAYGYTRPGAPWPGLDGFARSAMQEYPGLRVRVLGLEGDPARHASAIAQALGSEDVHVRLDGARWVAGLQALAPASAPEPELSGTTWLITGASGALGRVLAEALAARGCRLALTGRRAADASLQDVLTRWGERARYYPCDLAAADAVAGLVATIRHQFGAIHGVVHTAGITADALIARKTPAQIDAVLMGKLDAAYRLDACLADELNLRWFVLFGSLAGVTGNSGQADYAYANAGLAHFAAWREELRAAGERQGLSLCLEWPYWRDGGMRLDARTLDAIAKHTGLQPLPSPVGLAFFFQALTRAGGALGLAYGATQRIAGLFGLSQTPPAAPQPAADHALARRVEDRLLDLAAHILKIDKAQFDPEDPMDAYGFDSINLSALAHELGEQYGITLLPATFFEYPTLRDFAGYLAREHREPLLAKLGSSVELTASTAAPPPAPEPTPRRRAFRLAANAAPEPIAVVGMSAILPGADNLKEFWAALESGLDLVSEIPASRWDWRQWHGSPAAGKTLVNRAGFMRRVDSFDAAFFGISPKEAALMDPQHRLFLQAAWHAIEDAGHKPSDFNGRNVGLFVGVSSFDYQEILRASPEGVHAHELTGNAHSILANRVSYLLNLRGPSEPVDTACSSSLVAVHRAIRALRAGECEAALVGGVNVLLSPLVQLAFAKAGMLSPDGRCKTFDAAADGYVRGEGVGALLLKPLSLAKRDGNPIDALILGSAVNHGGRAHHLVAPNPRAQAEVVAAAVADADVDPRSISYIEVHGTGTALGDPIEINGLKLAFAELLATTSPTPPDAPFCALGSVKTNIGHLEAAAGVAGLVKLLLCLRQGRLPGNHHLREPNPQIRLENSPFYLLKAAQDWQRPTLAGRVQPRRAGISSFGFGGVNAHVVLEEAPAAPGVVAAGRGPWLFVFSAKDDSRLRAVVEAFLTLDTLPDLERMAYTLQVGREALPQRVAIIARCGEDLRRGLRSYLDGMTDPEVLRGHAADAGVLSSLLDEEEGEHYLATLLKAGKFRTLARFWVAGLAVDWAQAYPDPKPARVHLPGYPFAETRYWAVEQPLWNAEPPPPTATRVAPEFAASVADFLRERLARVAGFAPAALDPDADLEALGLDSILAMELLRDIETAYGLRLFPSELAEHRSLSALAAYIERERGTVLAPTTPPPRETPPLLFLLSTPRAGSTLLRAMLMGHSRLFAPPELHLLPFTDMAQRHQTLAQTGTAFLEEGLVQTLCALDGLAPDAAKAQIADWMAAETPVSAVYDYLQARLGNRCLVDKSPSYAQSLEVLRRAELLEPKPRYLHLVRHPLAMADSFVRNRFHRLLGAGESPWPLALNLWDEYNAHLEAFLAEQPAGCVFRLHYEDVVTAPEMALRALCRWLAIDFEPGLLDPYQGERLTQGLHAASLPIGDPNFHSHRRIEPALAKVPVTAWEQLAALDGEFLARALRQGYCLDLAPMPLAPAQAAALTGQEQLVAELLIHHVDWLDEPIDPAALAWAWRQVVRKHLVLRHSFYREAGRWWQQPLPDSEPVFVVGTADESDAEWIETLRQGLDWRQGRMAGCGLRRHSDGRATVTLILHHLVADGVSLAWLYRDLVAAYREPSALGLAVDDRYRRYAHQTQNTLPPQADLEHWRQQIATPCRLPLDSEGANVHAHEASLRRVLSLADLGLAAASPDTRHLRLLTALLHLLRAWTGQSQPVIALRRHGRVEPFHDAVGWFACDMPLAVEVAADFDQTLANLSAQLAAMPAAESGYLQWQLAGALPPLSEVAPLRFNYQPKGSFTGRTERLVTDPTAPRPYLIDWIVREQGDTLEVIVRHAQTLHTGDTLAGWLDLWQQQLTPRSP